MMRLLRLGIALVFIASLALFGWYWFRFEIQEDKTYPVINIENDVLEVNLDADEATLLTGVTAYDEKDGDLTDKIIVESISKFTEIGVCKVYYAVCDNDNHVASGWRKIVYRGYTSPRFYMNSSLCFSQMETIDASTVIGAMDVIDGDITANVIITSSDYEFGALGTYSVRAEVSNSKGDQISVTIPMIVEDRNINAPSIELSEYLIYLDQGDPVNPGRYFLSANDSFNEDVSESLLIESNVNTAVPGVYSVHYYAYDRLNRQGHTVLTVVVE